LRLSFVDDLSTLEVTMKGTYRALLSLSALASTLAVAPGVWAQSGTATDTAGSATMNMKDQMTDTAVTSKVTAALSEDKDTSALASVIHVDTMGGVVTLTGDVPSKEAAEHAQMVVARLSGVRDVVNSLKYPSASGHADAVPQVVPPQSSADSSTNPVAASTNVANTAADPAVPH
jgi:hyperosmotically inducible protein